MKKNLLFAIGIIIIVILCIAIIWMYKPKEQRNENVPITTNNTPKEEMKPDLLEQKENEFSSKIIESDNKEYVTLIVGANLFEGTKTLQIVYDNAKNILNTTNPILKDVSVIKEGNKSSFEIQVNQLENESFIFTKKGKNIEVKSEDIVIKVINRGYETNEEE